jgi:hypothetical protein
VGPRAVPTPGDWHFPAVHHQWPPHRGGIQAPATVDNLDVEPLVGRRSAIPLVHAETDVEGDRDMIRCEHDNFSANVKVIRLTETEGGPVTGYTTDISVKCNSCGIPFRFRGRQYGSSPDEPALSADGLELRAPIEPQYVKEICGMPVVSGNA